MAEFTNMRVVFVGGPRDGEVMEIRPQLDVVAFARPLECSPWDTSLNLPTIMRGSYDLELAPDGRPVCDLEDGVACLRFLWKGWD
jgi:hypothetical protein